MSNPDDSGFIAAICADPFADDLRSIYADWCEERGIARGEFIRTGLTLADWEKCPQRPPEGAGLVGWLIAIHKESRVIAAFAEDTSPCDCEACLRQHERELLEAHQIEWEYPLWMVLNLNGDSWTGASPWTFGYSRGLVGAIRCSEKLWSAHGPELVKLAPIVDVGITDRMNRSFIVNGHRVVWNRPSPEWWTRNDRIFESREMVHQAVSRAAVDWARAKAGLPALKQPKTRLPAP